MFEPKQGEILRSIATVGHTVGRTGATEADLEQQGAEAETEEQPRGSGGRLLSHWSAGGSGKGARTQAVPSKLHPSREANVLTPSCHFFFFNHIHISFHF